MQIKAEEIYKCGHFYYGIISVDGRQQKRGPFKTAAYARAGLQARIDWLKELERRRIEKSTQER